MPLQALKVVPATVELKAGETQAFEALGIDHQPADRVKWTVAEPGFGHIDEASGVYSAPSRVFTARRLAIVATQHDPEGKEIARGSAVVELDPARSWTPVLGTGWVALFALLLSVLLWKWPELCVQCAPPGVFVSPPVVTLTKGQAQQFLANAAVTWTNTVNAAGLYVAPSSVDAEQTLTITATSTSDPRQSAVGVVRLSPSAGLAVFPARVTVQPGGAVQLNATVTGAAQPVKPTWLNPAIGQISPEGLFTAPKDSQPQALVVLAQALVPAAGNVREATLLGASLVSIIPASPGPCEPSGSPLWRVILLVAGVGALGGITHAMGSFGTYVGNRELKASWLWWYAMKPALSAAVAVLVFLVFRAGLGAPDLGLDEADCFTVAGFAGLVGLFAEPATVKLKDIFEAIFTPRRDPRVDRAGHASATAAAELPEISSVVPKVFKGGQSQELEIRGKNFAKEAGVRIGAVSLPINWVSASLIKVAVPGDKLTPNTYPVIVFNKPGGGEASQPFEIIVQQQ
jgi:hypothetical protein